MSSVHLNTIINSPLGVNMRIIVFDKLLCQFVHKMSDNSENTHHIIQVIYVFQSMYT